MNEEFFAWLSKHESERATVTAEALVEAAGGPQHLALVGVDVVVGFCHEGPLASERIAAKISDWKSLLERFYELGVRDFFFPCDAHPEDSPEFKAFPPHCLEGTRQSEIVPEISSLPFVTETQRIDKRSICSLTNTLLAQRLLSREIRGVLCFGDCTDLCLYQLASGLRSLANSKNHGWRVWVVADLAETYDLSIAQAQAVEALPHPAELMNSIFLYHLELQGVEVFRALCPS